MGIGWVGHGHPRRRTRSRSTAPEPPRTTKPLDFRGFPPRCPPNWGESDPLLRPSVPLVGTARPLRSPRTRRVRAEHTAGMTSETDPLEPYRTLTTAHVADGCLRV